jgi:hypothetical protein
MQCQICDKEVSGLFVCDLCGKHACKDCASLIGESTVCGECVGKRQGELLQEKKEAPVHRKILGHGGVIIILSFWVLVGAAYLAIKEAPPAGGWAASPSPEPKNVEIADYRPVCNADGVVYALELSLTNTGNEGLSVETIIINDKNADFTGEKNVKPGETKTYDLGAQDIFGAGFSRSSMPRGAKVLVVTNKGGATKLLTTNPAACVQK